MQESHLNAIADHIFSTNKLGEAAAKATSSVQAAADIINQITKDIPGAPKGLHLPTQKDIEAMLQYGQNYLKQSPGSSKRRVRNAIKKRFRITYVPVTSEI